MITPVPRELARSDSAFDLGKTIPGKQPPRGRQSQNRPVYAEESPDDHPNFELLNCTLYLTVEGCENR